MVYPLLRKTFIEKAIDKSINFVWKASVPILKSGRKSDFSKALMIVFVGKNGNHHVACQTVPIVA
jgi:hypothetical protein